MHNDTSLIFFLKLQSIHAAAILFILAETKNCLITFYTPLIFFRHRFYILPHLSTPSIHRWLPIMSSKTNLQKHFLVLNFYHLKILSTSSGCEVLLWHILEYIIKHAALLPFPHGFLVDSAAGDGQMSWFDGRICRAYASSQNSQKHCDVFLNSLLAAYFTSNCFQLTHFGTKLEKYCL